MKVISVAGGQFEGMQVVSKSLVSDFGWKFNWNYSQSQKITSSYNRYWVNWVIIELYFPLLMKFSTRAGVKWFDPSPPYVQLGVQFIRCPLDMALDGRGKDWSSTASHQQELVPPWWRLQGVPTDWERWPLHWSRSSGAGATCASTRNLKHHQLLLASLCYWHSNGRQHIQCMYTIIYNIHHKTLFLQKAETLIWVFSLSVAVAGFNSLFSISYLRNLTVKHARLGSTEFSQSLLHMLGSWKMMKGLFLTLHKLIPDSPIWIRNIS